MIQLSSQVSVIVVDDDDVHFMSIERGFRKVGVENTLLRARDGVEALELLRGEGDLDPVRDPFLLLVDLRMPRMSGLELIRELRNDPHLKRTVAFVHSTSDADQDRDAAYDLNVAGYLVKDSDPVGLANMLREYWRRVQLPATDSRANSN